ncbi:GNAT family acetyltransferase [Arachidicoccus ginsenosidimutans]|uniref:GNAT family N-acetyltransferase n=1 Tax=Arachidicoccus sp. BS20 TaxID=1850526 RepID=UPI0007F13ED6|nr:GNAT family N-acetyltransferase [Arachidicoccus sp. BS20]ANI90001.1 GNAT family acetyltransferase [Arachidicoccus sp. BS20]
MILIRKAKKEDCPQMMNLVNELALFEKAPQEVTVTLQHFEASGFSETPVWWAFVAEDDETKKLVALGLYYVRYSTWKGQRMYLEDLIVTEKYRGRGIGKMLFEKLMEEAKEKKFSGMAWQALDWNTPALDFYKKYDAKFDNDWVNCSIDF